MAPSRPVRSAYHGVVPLTSCLSSAGKAVQERKGLMKMERQTVFREEVGHTRVKVDDRAFLGGSHNDDYDSGSAETPLASSGSDEGNRGEEGGACARRNARDENTGGCCTVTVTTSFIPHAVRS